MEQKYTQQNIEQVPKKEPNRFQKRNQIGSKNGTEVSLMCLSAGGNTISTALWIGKIGSHFGTKSRPNSGTISS